MRVIAESVEADGHGAFLLKNNCDEMHGYHHSKPVSARAIETLRKAAASLPFRFPLKSAGLKRLRDRARRHRHALVDRLPGDASRPLDRRRQLVEFRFFLTLEPYRRPAAY
ncbi:hypothetical protein [Mesorhizobium sp. WSM4311]|uniref:hypothetical protein n=1 Tax=Mesorhizobium sp. WSM4311 TaxID=2029410 RepID=UPI00115DC5B2|nr:hypothetical protein [Mesorhizobium sp. WSM4311]TRD00199.1 hypothetical protein FJV82_21405 [Mesorhizobium sp. WSM4305]